MSRSGGRDASVRVGVRKGSTLSTVMIVRSTPPAGSAAAVAKQAMPGLQGAVWSGDPRP